MFDISLKDIFDTTDTDAPVIIAHGVNLKGVMGAGFAKLISHKYPKAFTEYKEALATQTLVLGLAQLSTINDQLTIANCASQTYPGPDATEEALKESLYDLYSYIEDNVEVRLPLIGGGIGGIAPEKAMECIQEVAEDYNNKTTLYLQERDHATSTLLKIFEKNNLDKK